MNDYAIKISDLSKKYRLGLATSSSLRESLMQFSRKKEKDHFFALQDVNLTIKPGEALGIIGKNGAGKSTLLKILSKITYPTRGKVEIQGRVSSLLEVGTGFHAELTGRENVFLNGTILGMRKAEVKQKFDEIVEFSGVSGFIDTPIKHYSSGMKVRLAFSVAAFLEPEILIIDEVLAVGDAEFQKKCLGKMEDVTGDGRTVIFVSHNMGAVRTLCNTGVLLDHGKITYKGGIEECVTEYLRPLIESTKIDMTERNDRHGTGEVFVSQISITNIHNDVIESAFCGQDLKIKFLINEKNPVDYKRIIIGIAINDSENRSVSLHHSRLNGVKFSKPGQFVLTIKKLSLVPGSYIVNYSLLYDGDFLDRMESAFILNVVPGNFYETAEIPPVGNLLIDGKWSYENY